MRDERSSPLQTFAMQRLTTNQRVKPWICAVEVASFSPPGNRRMLSQSRPRTYPLKACRTTNRPTIGLYSGSEGLSRVLVGQIRAIQSTNLWEDSCSGATCWSEVCPLSMQPLAAHELRQLCSIRPFDDALLGDDDVNQVGGCDIEYRVERMHISAHSLTTQLQQLTFVALFDGDVFAAFQRHVDG